MLRRAPSPPDRRHLAFLRTAGLLFSHRRGKEIWYEASTHRVQRVQWQGHGQSQGDSQEGQGSQGDGRFSLTLTSPDGGVAVTSTMGAAAPPAAGPNTETAGGDNAEDYQI